MVLRSFLTTNSYKTITKDKQTNKQNKKQKQKNFNLSWSEPDRKFLEPSHMPFNLHEDSETSIVSG